MKRAWREEEGGWINGTRCCAAVAIIYPFLALSLCISWIDKGGNGESQRD